MPAHRYFPRAALSCVLLLASTLIPLAVQAQLYSWKDAEGNVTIKTSPPPWYKEDERSRGPRVQVLREGKVIDDTSWPLERRLEGRAKSASQEATRAAASAEEQAPSALQAAQAAQGKPALIPDALKAVKEIREYQKQDPK